LASIHIPKQMRTVVSSDSAPANQVPAFEVFDTTLSDGRVITIREMTGRDLIYMEEELEKFGETKKSFYLMERLNVGDQKVTFDEIADLKLKDIKKITELVSKANGDEPEDPK